MPVTNNRTQDLLRNIVDYLKDALNEQILHWNTEHVGIYLPEISESDVGYRDVLVGLRFYPALLVTETARDCSQPYFTTYTLNLCIAHRNDDIQAVQAEGSALLDCLEDVIRQDPTFGGLVMDCTDVRPEIDVVSGVYIAAIGLNVTVDLGSFDGMGGKNGENI